MAAGLLGCHRPGGVGVIVASSALLVVACGQPAGEATVPPPVTEPGGTSLIAGSSGGAPAGELPPGDPADLVELEEAWTAVWAAAGVAAADRPVAIESVSAHVGPDAAALVESGFAPDDTEREVVNHPEATANPDGTATISDCLFVWPAGLTGMSYWFEGAASRDGEGAWVIDAIEVRSRTGCLPAEIAEEILADYDEFWEARVEYWNPPDPDHPGVTGTMTGPHLEWIRGLLEQHQRDGWYAVNTVEAHHPEITEVLRPGQVVVQDCQLAAEDRGLFDSEGRLQPGLAPAAPGQRDRYEVTLTLEESQWKASDVLVQEAAACDFAPTPRGVPVV
jgi:hypothetical protein